MQCIRDCSAYQVLNRRHPVPKHQPHQLERPYIQCQNPIKLARGWKTPAKIKVRENINDVIIAAVGAFGVCN